MYQLSLPVLSNLKRGNVIALRSTRESDKEIQRPTPSPSLGPQFAFATCRKVTRDGDFVVNAISAHVGWDPNSMIQADFILPGGALYVPGAERLLPRIRRLTAAARNRKVDLAELRGGTFTISNYGALGGRFATPLIRPPEVGIMGFGAIRPRPFVVDGEVRARPTLPWSLSADHRLIDGDVATAFAEYVTGLLADPVALLAELLVAGS